MDVPQADVKPPDASDPASELPRAIAQLLVHGMVVAFAAGGVAGLVACAWACSP
jgi:hypothetical protein